MSKVFRSYSAPIPTPSKPPAGRPPACFAPAISRQLLFIWILALLGSESSGWAQVTGAISGRLEDATGAAIAATTITVKTLETGATRTVLTDDGGNFRIVAL